jgi:hypothetical protein
VLIDGNKAHRYIWRGSSSELNQRRPRESSAADLPIGAPMGETSVE